jgi:hypothetical protein
MHAAARVRGRSGERAKRCHKSFAQGRPLSVPTDSLSVRGTHVKTGTDFGDAHFSHRTRSASLSG